MKEIIAFHVGFGGSSDANWSLDEYEVLIRDVLAVGKYQVVLTFGPDEVTLCETMKQKLKGTSSMFHISDMGIVEFAKLTSNFKLFISTSTGTYHLASLVGTPTLTFFADSLFASALRWKGVGAENLQENYMIPQVKAKRNELFEFIQERLGDIK